MSSEQIETPARTGFLVYGAKHGPSTMTEAGMTEAGMTEAGTWIWRTIEPETAATVAAILRLELPALPRMAVLPHMAEPIRG
jgi:hypothetical protein